jgi:prevent-host-death family protein
MMRSVSVTEAKASWSRLLDEAAGGKTIVITRRGVPVAQLAPPPATRLTAAEAVEQWRAYRRRENITLGGLSIRELIEEGRRF